MKIVNKYKYPSSTRAKISGLRHYSIDGSEQKLPSVTTILGETQPKEKKESLDKWRAKVGLREAQRITRDAAIRGTAMHKYLEDLCRGQRSLDLTPIGQRSNGYGTGDRGPWSKGCIGDLWHRGYPILPGSLCGVRGHGCFARGPGQYY